jgi:DNA-directed RNA polymerase subunit RPC12/RpoP
MNGYHCLNCGEKLKQLSMNLSTDKYECSKCGTEWYKVRHIIVEWVEGEKKESEVEEDG